MLSKICCHGFFLKNNNEKNNYHKSNRLAMTE